jgi:Prokaryotic N-terminal methylation motif
VRDNQSGFSIIEVLVSFAVLALVAIGFAMFTDNHSKVTKSIEAGFEVVDFVGQVRLVLSQPRACKRTLTMAGAPLQAATHHSIGDIKASTSIPHTNPIAWNDYIFKAVNNPVSPSGNVVLTSMHIKYPPTFNGEVELIMRLERADKASMGGHYFLRSIPITIVADTTVPTLIGNCFASGAKVASWPAMCETLGGKYDPVTKKCSELFKVDYTSDIIPDVDHYERLEMNGGVVKIVVD